MENDIKTRDVTIDIQRVFAIFLVVIGHSLWFTRLKTNITAQLIFHFFFFSVPLFFYLSGYSLGFNLKYQKDISLIETLRKTTKKLVFPLVLWYFIYILWTISYYELYPLVYGINPNYTILDLLTSKYRGFHLWFIAALVFYYLLFYYLSQEERYRSNSFLLFFFSVTVIFTTLQYLQYYLEGLMVLQYTPFPYVFFFVLGLWLYDKKKEIESKSRKLYFKIFSGLIFLLGLSMIIIETLYGPIGVSNVRYSIFVFTLGFILLSVVLNSNNDKLKALQNLSIQQIRENIMYDFILKMVKAIPIVYFIHIIVLDILTMTFYFIGFSLDALIIISLIAILNVIFSFSLTILLNQN